VTPGDGPVTGRAASGTTRPVQVSAWNIANALTVLRIALVPVFGWLLLFDGGHETRYRILAAGVFVLASITDRIDGDIARARGIVTDFGKVSDPIADKALMGTALVGLSVLGELPWWVTIVVLVREVGITAMRFVVIRHGVMPASRGGKVKTVLQAFAIGLYVLPLSGAWHVAAELVMAAAVLVTVATGVDYVIRARTLRRTSPRAQAKRARRAARLAMAEPAVTQPAVTQPAVTQPAVTQPAVTEPAVTQPAVTEEVSAEPGVSEAVSAEPGVTGAASAEPAVTQPAQTAATENTPGPAGTADRRGQDPLA
jgi:CDP-diacylglycerol--glycerol-3-phosphate 3-phosphatidyltransferase